MKWLIPFLLVSSAFGQQVGTDIIPTTSGLNLGHSNQRWNAFLQTLNVSGTCTLNGVPCNQNFFNPHSPGPLGDVIPGAGNFSSVTSSQFSFTNAIKGGEFIGGSVYAVGSAGAIHVSGWCNSGLTGTFSNMTCLNYADPSVAIQAIVSFYGSKSTIYVIDDMCDIDTWSVQPAVGSGSNLFLGTLDIMSSCPTGNPHIISLDGISTIKTPNGFNLIGHGTAQGGLTPQYGGTGNTIQGTYIRMCNPAIYPCLHGGFQIQSGTVDSTGALASNLSLVTMTGAPFVTSSTAINHLGQYDMVQIVGATNGGTTNNAAWVVTDVVSTTAPQSYHIAATTGFGACASPCVGTAYLATPAIAIGSGGNGVFGNILDNFTVDCSFMPGSAGWVNGAGQELNSITHVNAWNCTVFGGRIDQSCAYAGVNTCTGSTNSGPYGPFSSNIQAVTCGLSGGCGCMGASTNCSSAVLGTPGTVPLGTAMSVGASGSFATISPDPAVNSNFACFLFTGGAGQQGFGPMDHVTCTISDKSSPGATAVPQLQKATTGSHTYGNGGVVGTPGTIGTGIVIAGIHGSLSDLHTEYVNSGVTFGGDPNRSGTFYYAYTGGATPVPTSGWKIDGGFGQVTGAGGVMFGVGGAKADAAIIGDIEVANYNAMNGGGAIIWQNNITGETCLSNSTAPGSNYVFSGFFGHSVAVATTKTNGEPNLLIPQERTSCTNLAHFTGNAFAVPLVSTSAITNYGVPVKIDTSNANQFVQTVTGDAGSAGIVAGVSYHATSAGGYGQVVTSGIVPMIFGTNGTGNCAIGNFVLVDSTTNGHVKCGAYVAGTVIGIALQAQTTTDTPFLVLVGLR